ncbi:hypothetical protein Fmac_007925 [Flemingia macrophylla]|uniref:Uncharacterized protein n=1 Tax=Flemingia macrophylla TaxID=520843 RepID=A0ABD1MVX8_9FABA
MPRNLFFNSSAISRMFIPPFTKSSSSLFDLPHIHHIRPDNTNNTVNKFKGESFLRGLGEEGVGVDELDGGEGNVVPILHDDLRVM